MKYGRTYNFSAGPAMMPEEVLEEIAAEMMNYRGSGMCVMEMSDSCMVWPAMEMFRAQENNRARASSATAPRSFSRSGTRPRRTCVS